MEGEMMDLALLEAARKGDVIFLKETIAVQPPEYFLTQEEWLGIAAAEGNVEFLTEAMNILSPHILKQLLFPTTNAIKKTVLHIAAEKSNIIVVKCIKEMYASLSWDNENRVKPWLALTEDEETPLNVVLKNSLADEKCVMEIMLMDPELESWTIADKDGNTPLYYAVKNGYNLVAENILMSPHPAPCILGPKSFLDLLCIATRCSGNVVRLLFEKCDGRLFNDGNTTLHSALHSTSTQELALEILSTYPAMREIRNNRGESPFFLAVRFGCEQVVDKIMSIEEPRFHMLRRNDGTTVLHNLSSCPEKTGQMLLQTYWWINNLRDYQGNTALDYATQEKAHWLVNLLTNPSLIKKQDFDWIEACKREETEAVQALC